MVEQPGVYHVGIRLVDLLIVGLFILVTKDKNGKDDGVTLTSGWTLTHSNGLGLRPPSINPEFPPTAVF